MNKSKLLLMLATVGLIAATAGWLAHSNSRQKLGQPGVKTVALPNSIRLRVELPERVLDYSSERLEPDTITTNGLPKDTSFGVRRYQAPDGFGVLNQVVLMGSDRTSLHKPQFCLEGQGLHIDDTASELVTVRIGGEHGYDMPIMKLVAQRVETLPDGRQELRRYLYVYWYVADGAVSAGTIGFERMWLMAKELICTGVLQRWAYVSCLAVCLPGQEAATFDRLKQFIVASVPQFQYPPKQSELSASAKP